MVKRELAELAPSITAAGGNMVAGMQKQMMESFVASFQVRPVWSSNKLI
jgi:hypothetical protein